MSIHQSPTHPDQDPSEVARLSRAFLGREPAITKEGAVLTMTFTPDLTAGEQTTLAQVTKVAGLMRVTPAEWDATAADRATLVAFLAISAPTLAQTHAAVKAMVRTMRVLFRD